MSATAAETALFFLYGKRPKITDLNVSAILELAEFLIIPNLKSACVKYLKTVPVTDENCMAYLIISSLYDFEFKKCYGYIKGHLIQVLKREEALCLTKHSVVQLLTDPVLMYVSAENKFEFIVRWASVCSKHKADFPEIFDLVNLEKIDINSVNHGIMSNPVVVENKCLEKLQAMSHISHHNTILFSSTISDNKYVCFDLENKKWYGLKIEIPNYPGEEDAFRQFRYGDQSIHAIKPSAPHKIYRVKSNYESTKVCEQDMCSKEAKVYELEGVDCPRYINISYISGSAFVAIENKSHQRSNPMDQSDDVERRRLLQLALLNQNLELFSQLSLLNMINQRGQTRTETATVFHGDLRHPRTVLKPIVTILNTRIDKCCLNSYNMIGLLSESNGTLYVYEFDKCYLHEIDLKVNNHQRSVREIKDIQPLEDGFVLFNEQQILVVSCSIGPSLTNRFNVRKVELEYDRSWHTIQYYFCDNTWYRCLKESWENDTTFATVSHDTLMSDMKEKVHWQTLPVQDEVKSLIRDGDRVFMVQLPKSMLTCHVNCPHCQQLNSEATYQRKAHNTIDEDYMYDDSDDPSYYDDSDSISYWDDGYYFE